MSRENDFEQYQKSVALLTQLPSTLQKALSNKGSQCQDEIRELEQKAKQTRTELSRQSTQATTQYEQVRDSANQLNLVSLAKKQRPVETLLHWREALRQQNDRAMAIGKMILQWKQEKVEQAALAENRRIQQQKEQRALFERQQKEAAQKRREMQEAEKRKQLQQEQRRHVLVGVGVTVALLLLVLLLNQ